jgi:CRP/FNR family cyclic AMP-dependent transcriptional regulator
MGLRPEYSRLLSGLPARLSTELFANAELVRLRAGQVLFRTGDPGHGCYRVEDGLLKVRIVSSSSGERILSFLGRGAIVGELSVIDGLPRSASVVAVRNAVVSFLSSAAFEAFAENHPELYKSLVRLLAQRLRETDTLVAAGSFLSLKGRVARTLLELAEHFGHEVEPGRIIIRQKISQHAGFFFTSPGGLDEASKEPRGQNLGALLSMDPVDLIEIVVRSGNSGQV